jgi:hypothetical protein
MQAKLPTADEIDYNHVWSEVDEMIVPVDPADCDACQGISPNPCFNHYRMGAEFQ